MCCHYVFWSSKYKKSENGSEKKRETLKQIRETKRHRDHLDGSMDLIGAFLYGPHRGSFILNTLRQPGIPLVDDWGCLKSTVITDSSFHFVNSLPPVFVTLTNGTPTSFSGSGFRNILWVIDTIRHETHACFCQHMQ